MAVSTGPRRLWTRRRVGERVPRQTERAADEDAGATEGGGGGGGDAGRRQSVRLAGVGDDGRRDGAGGQGGEEAVRVLALHRADDETDRAVEPDLAPARAGQALARAPRDGYSVEKPPDSFELRAGKAGLADDRQWRADAQLCMVRNLDDNRAVLSLLIA